MKDSTCETLHFSFPFTAVCEVSAKPYFFFPAVLLEMKQSHNSFSIVLFYSPQVGYSRQSWWQEGKLQVACGSLPGLVVIWQPRWCL